MLTLCIRYTLDAAKLADFEAYAHGLAGPIERVRRRGAPLWFLRLLIPAIGGLIVGAIGWLCFYFFYHLLERLNRTAPLLVAQVPRIELERRPLFNVDLRSQWFFVPGVIGSLTLIIASLLTAFAVVREAGKRVLQMRHFDVQMIGGIALHQGKIGEMPTGEGKTLVATLPAYLNALSGKGVHVVTVNDYLAKRDSEWMGRIYGFLGLTVGVILSGAPFGFIDPKTQEQKGFNIERRKIHLADPIKVVGEYQVPVKLHKEVSVQIAVNVVAEEA